MDEATPTVAYPVDRRVVRHTVGPWQCYADLPSTDPNWHIITSSNRTRVIANIRIEPGNEMDAANARLITAAPDLLFALQKLLAEGWTNDASRAAADAIAKVMTPNAEPTCGQQPAKETE